MKQFIVRTALLLTVLLTAVGTNPGPVAAVSPSQPEQASAKWRPGRLYVELQKHRYECGSDMLPLKCWDFQVRVVPAGWYKGKNFYLKYKYERNDKVIDRDSDSCKPYTDGNNCTRRSQEWTYTVPPSKNEQICVNTYGYQYVQETQTVSDSETRCFWTQYNPALIGE
ncbi:hypothetical protein [Nocardioides speluncae]|uniref:hypothetical protein n=1 Tax=Nocardioides speluncae TaxID=2670337 RepID=UPI0012B177CF|nr:hypothetical protein [Nocardioides speluncae]